jgi:hypothetical protein
MKLTKERLDTLIREVIQEHRGVPMEDRGIKGQQLAKKREEENTENTKVEKERKDKLYPGVRELMSLSRGVIAEGEMEEDEDGYIKVKKDAFHRLLTEQNEELAKRCNAIGMKTLEQFLNIANAFADASKGKFGEKSKK